jgi:uncharacterized membrane protein
VDAMNSYYKVTPHKVYVVDRGKLLSDFSMEIFETLSVMQNRRSLVWIGYLMIFTRPCGIQ